MITPTPGTKMQFLIKRRDGVSREELAANWFANHMPAVIARENGKAGGTDLHAKRYIATIYEPDRSGALRWDGVAQLWFDAPLPRATSPHGAKPLDTFQQKAEPYVGWPTTEFVALDGELPGGPNTMNDPFPYSRSGFLKVTSLLTAKADTDIDAFFAHWLNVHAPNVVDVLNQVGGMRYAISQSQDPNTDPYTGMAEIWLPDKDALRAYSELFTPDGIEDFVDREHSPILWSHTEFVGIP